MFYTIRRVNETPSALIKLTVLDFMHKNCVTLAGETTREISIDDYAKIMAEFRMPQHPSFRWAYIFERIPLEGRHGSPRDLYPRMCAALEAALDFGDTVEITTRATGKCIIVRDIEAYWEWACGEPQGKVELYSYWASSKTSVNRKALDFGQLNNSHVEFPQVIIVYRMGDLETILTTPEELGEWQEARGRDLWLGNDHRAERMMKGEPESSPEEQIAVKRQILVNAKLLAERATQKPVPTKAPQSSAPLADSNLKTAAAAGKATMASVPPVALFAMGAAFADGAAKYGRYNWRGTEVTASVFYDAMQRHLSDWYNGETHADDSNLHHLAHLMAGCGIVIDAELHDVFVDDRPKHAGPSSISREPSAWKKVD